MEKRQEIYNQLNELLSKGDWYDILQLCKKDETYLTLVTLIQIASTQKETLDHIKSILNH